ncbi:MAG TPA: HPr kinase/phosphorylase, partial [Cupriavidus sp.]|nr:HPr kinase/phosphorylase [Cupriavidus sp.]
MELTGVTSQSIFDDNAADIKLSWVAGLEGADRAFDVEFAREATSA